MGIPQSFIDASQEVVVRPIWLLEFYLDAGTEYFCSDHAALTWNGNTYAGAGVIGSISAIDENINLNPSRILCTLTGIPSDEIQTALNVNYQRRKVILRLLLLDEEYQQIAAYPWFEGVADQMEVVVGEDASVTLSVVNELVRWEIANVRRYTNEDQQEAHPGDTGMSKVLDAVQKEILWGTRGGISWNKG